MSLKLTFLQADYDAKVIYYAGSVIGDFNFIVVVQYEDTDFKAANVKAVPIYDVCIPITS